MISGGRIRHATATDGTDADIQVVDYDRDGKPYDPLRPSLAGWRVTTLACAGCSREIRYVYPGDEVPPDYIVCDRCEMIPIPEPWGPAS